MANRPIPSIFGPMGYHDSKQVLFGLECEIEQIRAIPPSILDVWGRHEDGSLRENGMEFVSPPDTLDETLNKFKFLHTELKTGNNPFSERTSIHVHVNMQNLGEQEVKNIIFLYALYEEFFFMCTIPSRRENIHCVPLTETFLPQYYSLKIESLCNKWQKYTAMNTKPLSNLGTLEFRHMHGHNDVVKLQQWLTLLEKLVKLGATMPEMDRKWLTNDKILEMFLELFNHIPEHTYWKHLLSQKTFNPKLDLKLSFIR
jgi:hypothetical protein